MHEMVSVATAELLLKQLHDVGVPYATLNCEPYKVLGLMMTLVPRLGLASGVELHGLLLALELKKMGLFLLVVTEA